MQDWDRIPALWRYALTSRLTSNISEHPLLMTEPAWNPPKNREKTMEVAFEDFNVPAFYLARSAVCSGFASGKASGLVVDVGASNVAVTPIHDGFILRKGVMHAPIGGDFLSAQIRQYLAHTNIPLTPHYQVLAKTQVDVGQPAKATLRDPKTFPATDSYRRFQEERVLTEFKECVVQVWPGPGPLPPTGDNAYGARTFEFPDGFNLVFGGERYHLAEGLFNTQRAIAPLPADGSSAQAQGVTSLVWAAMKDVDLELKQHILSNVVVVGAGSLLYGFTDRLNGELSSAFPGPRVRITAPGNSIERRYSAWLGGSILASLGSFHQMWVSKKEYEEHGMPSLSLSLFLLSSFWFFELVVLRGT